eukprot:208474-Prymnesium_polylepis.1
MGGMSMAMESPQASVMLLKMGEALRPITLLAFWEMSSCALVRLAVGLRMTGQVHAANRSVSTCLGRDGNMDWDVRRDRPALHTMNFVDAEEIEGHLKDGVQRASVDAAVTGAPVVALVLVVTLLPLEAGGEGT